GYEPVRPEWAGWPFERRIETARGLLHDAGYGAGRPVELELLYNTRDRDKRIVAAIAAMWKQRLGVETHLVNQEWKVYLQTRKQLDRTQVFRSGWIGEYPDPNTFAEILHSTHSMNEFGWRNERYDALLEKAAASTDRQARFALFNDAEREIQANVPLIPLFHYAKARLVSPAVAGYHGNLMDHHYSRQLSWRELHGR
ncbi:MAG TPA: ABC transporter substrate-binding protein, partial [Gammaproteobacteria bacterium]